MGYVIEFFNASMEAEIGKWPAGINASFTRIAEQMTSTGPNLGLPHTRPFGDGRFEIRARGPEGIGRAFSVPWWDAASSSCMASSRSLKRRRTGN